MYLKVNTAGQNANDEPEGELCAARQEGANAPTQRARRRTPAELIRAFHCAGSVDAPASRSSRRRSPRTPKSPARSCWCCGCRARRRTWTSSPRSATSARTVRTCGRSGSRADDVPVTKGWLRASHRKLDPESRCLTALTTRTPSVSGSSRASRSSATSKSGRRAWCSKKATAFARHPAAGRRRRLGVSALSRRLQHRGAEHGLRRRRQGVLSRAAGDSGCLTHFPWYSVPGTIRRSRSAPSPSALSAA